MESDSQTSCFTHNGSSIMCLEDMNAVRNAQKGLVDLSIGESLFYLAFDFQKLELLDSHSRQVLDLVITGAPWIKTCLNSRELSILLMVALLLSFPLSVVLGLGDPLSPFLFIVVLEGYIMLLRKPVGYGFDYCWKMLVDRFHMRLSSWKANLLSIGGRLTLIKSVLGSLAGVHSYSDFVKILGLGETPLCYKVTNRLYLYDQDKDLSISLTYFNNGQSLGIGLWTNLDTCTWSLGPNDTFTVKDARYRLTNMIILHLAHAILGSNHIPNGKVHCVMWRLSLGRLPHRLNLSLRVGMDIPAISWSFCNANVRIC
ncbi:hypothetical protein Tco_0134229 [Tanacetum coccineum]